MNDTYYNNNNNNNNNGATSGFASRKRANGNTAVSEMMRQSRMSVGYDHSSLERATPIEKAPVTGGPGRSGKFKPNGGSRLTMEGGGPSEYTQFSTLGGI